MHRMSALIPFLAIDQTCEQVQALVDQQLTSAGFRVVQTFDLQVARLAHPDCPCPHHGTDDCNCQMVILLVYGKNDNPVTLIVHGQDSRTWLSLANPTGQRADQRLEVDIRRVLVPYRSGIPSTIEVAHEARSTV